MPQMYIHRQETEQVHISAKKKKRGFFISMPNISSLKYIELFSFFHCQTAARV